MCQSFSLSATTRIPDLLRERPAARAVLDRYGLRGCGGRLGPAETIGFFARAHDVPVDRLLDELRAAQSVPAPPTEPPSYAADAIYRRFFLAGIGVVLTLGAVWGAVILGRIAWSGSFRAASFHEINAHGHAQIFGWIGLFVMGFAYQAFPRFKHTHLRWPALAFASWWLMLGGVVFRSVLEPLAAVDSRWIGAALLAGLAEIVAVSLCVVVLGGTWRRATKPIVFYDWYIFSALGWFVVQTVCDAAYFAATLLVAEDGKVDLIATWQAPLRDFQIHGFAMLMTLGVSQRLIHHVFGVRPPSARFSLIALPILNLAVIGEAVGLVLMRKAGHAWAGLWYASALTLAVTVAALVCQWRVFGRAQSPDRSLKFVRVAYVWLLISLAMIAFLPAYQFLVLPTFAPDSAAVATGFSHAYYGAARHAITVGFLSLMIVGVSSKIVPTLNGLDTAKLPALWLPFILIDAGCTLRVVSQVATDFTPVAYPIAGVSGTLEVAGLAIWGTHLAWIMIGGYRTALPGRSALTPGTTVDAGHRVGEVLEVYPQLLPVFLEHGFHSLENPVLRKRVASHVTVSRACHFAGVEEGELLRALNAKLGKVSLSLINPSKADAGCGCGGEHAHAGGSNGGVR